MGPGLRSRPTLSGARAACRPDHPFPSGRFPLVHTSGRGALPHRDGRGAWLLNRWGGDIREAILGLFFAVGGILLFSVLTSETVRRRLRAHVGKNFFASRYDYRTEWLRLTDRLSRAGDLGEIGGALLDFLRESVGARARPSG